jgi:hypothetical protein
MVRELKKFGKHWFNRNASKQTRSILKTFVCVTFAAQILRSVWKSAVESSPSFWVSICLIRVWHITLYRLSKKRKLRCFKPEVLKQNYRYSSKVPGSPPPAPPPAHFPTRLYFEVKKSRYWTTGGKNKMSPLEFVFTSFK